MRVSNATALVPPTGSGTTVLFDSFVAFSGIPLDVEEVVRYQLSVNNTQTGTLLVSTSTDGVNYNPFFTSAVAIPTGSLTQSVVDVPIEGEKYIRASWVNGGTNQSAGWNPQQSLTEKQRAAQV